MLHRGWISRVEEKLANHVVHSRSFQRLRGSDVQAARDMYYAHALLRDEDVLIAESGISTQGNFITRFGELFTIARVRRATQASGVVMIAQQMCGSGYHLTSVTKLYLHY